MVIMETQANDFSPKPDVLSIVLLAFLKKYHIIKQGRVGLVHWQNETNLPDSF